MKRIYFPILIAAVLIIVPTLFRITAHDVRKNRVTISIASPNSEPQLITYSDEILSNNSDVKTWPLIIEWCVFGPIGIILLSIYVYLQARFSDLMEFLKPIVAAIAVSIITIILFICSGTSYWESRQRAERMVQPTVTLAPTKYADPIPLTRDQNLYYLDIDIDAPENIVQGQSEIIQIRMGIFNAPPENNRIEPIGLFQRDYFSAISEIQVVNFSLSSDDNVSQETKRLEVNKPTTWSWILTPTDTAEGNQSILWNIFIDDGRDTQDLFLVSMILKIEVKPKHGIPSFLLNPNFSLISVLLGIWSAYIGFKNLQLQQEEHQRTKVSNEPMGIGILLKNSEGGQLFLYSTSKRWHFPMMPMSSPDDFEELSQLIIKLGLPRDWLGNSSSLLGTINISKLPGVKSPFSDSDLIWVFLTPSSKVDLFEPYINYTWVHNLSELNTLGLPAIYSEIFNKVMKLKR